MTLGRALAAVAVGVCLLATAFLCVNVPFGDDWDLLGPILASRHGHLALDDLWHVANEHRPFLPRAVALVLSFATDHDVRAMLVVSRALELVALVLLARVLGPAAPGRVAGSVLLAWIAALLFTATRYETWLWPVSSIQWSAHALAVAGVAALAGARGATTPNVCAAGVLVVVDGLGMSTAVAPWAVGLASLVLDRSHDRRWRHVAIWLAVGAALVAILGAPLWAARGASRPPLASVATLFVAMAGSPLAYRIGLVLPLATGAVVIAAYGAGAGLGRRDDARRPWIVLGAAAGLTMLVVSAARAASTAPEVMPARYTLDAAFLWMAASVLASAAATRVPKVVTALVAASLLSLYVRAYVAGWQSLLLLAGHFAAGREAVLAYEQACDDQLALVYPRPAKVRRYARALEALHLGPFADRRAGSGPCRDRRSPPTIEDRAPWGYAGAVDRLDCDAAAGWAVDAMRPGFVVPVEIHLDGKRVGAGAAEGGRFELPMPDAARDGRAHVVSVRLAGFDAELPPADGISPVPTCSR